MATWGCDCRRDCPHDNIGGGISRVFQYDASLTGAAYILKGLDSEVAKIRNDKNFYEARKFGGTCDLIISESLLSVLKAAIIGDGTVSTRQNGADDQLRSIRSLLRR